MRLCAGRNSIFPTVHGLKQTEDFNLLKLTSINGISIIF